MNRGKITWKTYFIQCKQCHVSVIHKIIEKGKTSAFKCYQDARVVLSSESLNVLSLETIQRQRFIRNSVFEITYSWMDIKRLHIRISSEAVL